MLVIGYTPTTWQSFKVRPLRESAQKVERNILLSFKVNFHQLKHTRAECRCQNQNLLEKLLRLEGKFLLLRCVVQKLWRKTCLLHYFRYKRMQMVRSTNSHLTFFIPLVPVVYYKRNQQVLLWLAIIPMYWCLRLALIGGIIASYVLLVNSTSQDKLGTAMSMAGLLKVSGRCVSALACASLYAWSLTNVKTDGNKHALGFPFDHFFAFFVLGFGAFVMTLITFKLPPSMDTKTK